MGPLAAQRAAYLQELAAQGAAQGTLLRRARYCLCVAKAIADQPEEHRFGPDEIAAMASQWAQRRTEEGRAQGPRWPQEHFEAAATDFLQALGRYREPVSPPGRYDALVDAFIAAQREGRWQSEASCRAGRWQVGQFLGYLEQQGIALSAVQAIDVDGYFKARATQWGRVSLRTAARVLRAWFAYCEAHRFVRPGVAAAILLPRIYQHEGLPMGPTWDQVGRMLSSTVGQGPEMLRDHAILRLLCVYGVRSGEVRRLALDDLDWKHDRIRFVQSKNGRQEFRPLEPSVGNALAQYLQRARPASPSRVVFLTLRAPHRPLSTSGLYTVVRRYLPPDGGAKHGRGPHGLRHACARHLVEQGYSFKEVGDYLGHRSPDATRIYAKVDLGSLRRVADWDLGGLR
jgi:site-specific recombinase XerD